MATVADSEEKRSDNPFNQSTTSSLEEAPWISYAAEQAQLLQKNLEETLDFAIVTAKSRISEIRSTSSAHFNQTLDSLQDVKSEYTTYEDALFGKLKEGVVIAASNPAITLGSALGLGIVVLKRPRRFLTRSALRLFMSEEALLSKAENKVKELRNAIELVKSEGEKLERQAVQAEAEFRRGQIKLRDTGKQIQGVIRSAYKIEGQARGLKDIVGELPNREASRFRSQISNLGYEAKRERNILTKEVSKIINHGIPI